MVLAIPRDITHENFLVVDPWVPKWPAYEHWTPRNTGLFGEAET